METIFGHRVDIDVRFELERYSWTRASWTHDKLLAASPFRYDSKPSFFVRLAPHGKYPAGVWADRGAAGGEFASGDFLSLLSFLRDETREETAEYLIRTYGTGERGSGPVKLASLRLDVGEKRQPLDMRILDPFKYRSPYLGSRGVSERIQLANSIGFDRQRRAVVLPWFTPGGQLANIKFRLIDQKRFFYWSGGWPVRELLYSLHLVYKYKKTFCVVVESEIDALYIMSLGIGVPAIAVGGSNFNEYQRDLILRSPLQEIAIATDNDEAGAKLREQIIESLRGRVDISVVNIPKVYKDVNEIEDREELQRIIVDREPVAEPLRRLRLYV